MNRPNFHVITGASGAGKSTLIAALRDAGYATVPEAALAVMRAQGRQRGTLIAPAERGAFMEAVVERSLADYRTAQSMQAPVFFDRAMPEWLRFLGPDTGTHYQVATGCTYAPTVFVAEPWPEIYINTDERVASFTRAARSYEPTVEAYVAAGYTTCVIPKRSVAERMAFVLAHVGASVG
ncbi:AAA family ATPase [Oleiagrimonas sp. C23AA]|uniref:AAA family ATPase n=1 Tax=Oleiagrimonas sp. C23AA TaxID=2719047 RepID=UPI001422F8D9|nr:AAA family ATPase [Oleiagrimonas sp. C23AA]NII09675.1 AAA family ATPase [Oleiagrimonas sp. C23AA]